MATPVVNTQLDTLNAHVNDIKTLLSAKNALDAERNTSLAILAGNGAGLDVDIDVIVSLVRQGKLRDLMDYGDQLVIPWTRSGTSYDAPFNFCHLENCELVDGETVPVADFEWDYTTIDGIVYDEPEAIYASSSNLAAGTYHFTVANDSWGGNNGKVIQFTLPQALTAGQQIRKSVAYNALITSGTLGVYADGASRTPLYTMTPTEGSSGTDLGTTDGSGDLNHWHRVALGYNRWSQSAARQYLNSTAAAGSWWTQQNKWDVAPAIATALDGFLHGYDADIISHFLPTKIQTACNTVTDSGVTDTTYDRVFLASLQQINITPQVADVEGEAWNYYKRLLGSGTTLATGTYPKLIKYALNAKTSAQYRWLRSANRGNAYYVWFVYSSGTVNYHGANNGHRLCPACRIG